MFTFEYIWKVEKDIKDKQRTRIVRTLSVWQSNGSPMEETMNKETKQEFKRQVQSFGKAIDPDMVREAQTKAKEIRNKDKPLTTWDILDPDTDRLIPKPIHWDEGPSIFTKKHSMEAE